MSDEFYHFGVPGMKWGVRKSIKERGAKKKEIHNKNASDLRDRIKRGSKFVDSVMSDPLKRTGVLAAITIGTVAANKYYDDYMTNRAVQGIADAIITNFKQ